MAFSLVQEAHDFSYSTGQKSLTLSGNITKGNQLLAWCISTDSASSNHPTIDGGYDLTWIPLISQILTGGYGYLSAWYAIVKRTRAATILIYGSNGVGSVPANLTEPSCQVIELSGNSTNPFVVSTKASGTNTSPQVALTATNPVGLVVGVVVPPTATADGVETAGWTNAAGANTKASAIYALESGSGTFTPEYSLTNSGEWGIFAVGFQVPGTTYTISGSLGSAGANASVLFASNTTQAVVFATADGSGNYTSPALENDTYIVIPQVAGAYFTPYSQTQVLSGANITALNFTSTAVRTDLFFSANWIDTMQRANENPLSNNGFWTQNGSPVPPWDYPLQILSDEGTFSNATIVANDAAPWKGDAVSVWAGYVLPPNDQWMELQIDALNSDPGSYATAFIEVRSSTSNTYCYRLAIQNNGDGTAQLSLIANHTDGTTQLPPTWENANGQQSFGAMTSNVSFALGDTVRLAIVGSILYVFHNGTLIGSFFDSDISSGTFCIELTGKATTDVQVSQFKSGGVSYMSIYNQLATDSFVRSTESPLSDGGNWAVPDASNYLVLTASQEVNGATDNICAQYYNGGITWPGNQYSEVTLTGGLSGAEAVGPAVLWQPGTRNGYGILFFPTTPGNFILQKYVDGAGSNLAQGTATYTEGDVVRLEVFNGVLTAKHNGTTIVTANDTTYTTGFPGLVTLNDNTTVGFSGPWNGGSISSLTVGSFISAPVSVTVTNSNGDALLFSSPTLGNHDQQPTPVVFTDPNGNEYAVTGATTGSQIAAPTPVVYCSQQGEPVTPPFTFVSNSGSITVSASLTGVKLGSPIPVVITNDNGNVLTATQTVGAFVANPTPVALCDINGNAITLSGI